MSIGYDKYLAQREHWRSLESVPEQTKCKSCELGWDEMDCDSNNGEWYNGYCFECHQRHEFWCVLDDMLGVLEDRANQDTRNWAMDAHGIVAQIQELVEERYERPQP